MFDEKFRVVNYSDLNSKQKENYNFHKVASALANYGFNSMRLNDDWQGADFIAVHIDGENMLKVQLKSRFSFAKKYIGKNLYIAFIEKEIVKLYYHDEALELMTNNVEFSKSWIETGLYTFNKTPVIYQEVISELN